MRQNAIVLPSDGVPLLPEAGDDEVPASVADP